MSDENSPVKRPAFEEMWEEARQRAEIEREKKDAERRDLLRRGMPLARKELCGTSRCMQKEFISVMAIVDGVQDLVIPNAVFQTMPSLREETGIEYEFDWMSETMLRSPGDISYYMCGSCGVVIHDKDGNVVQNEETICKMLMGLEEPGTYRPKEEVYLKTARSYKVTITSEENEILGVMLSQLCEAQCNAVCNDYYLLNTPENRKLVTAAYRLSLCDEDFAKWKVYITEDQTQIIASDFIILDYLAEKLKVNIE